MTSFSSKAILVLLPGLALAACSSGVDQAKDEMTEACVSSGNGELTESECGCMTDRTFAELNDEELDFVDRVYQLEPGISDAEAAEQIGMEPGEFQRLSRSFARKVSNNAFGAALECVTS